MKVLIDNGHGISTPGKCSPDGKHREYKWAREIARKIVISLKAKGYDAELLVPEEGDIALGQRVMRANAVCDMYGKHNVVLVSIHNNAAGNGIEWKTAGGWAAYTSKGQTKADMVANHLYQAADRFLKEYKKLFEAEKKKGSYDSKQRPIRTDYGDGDPDMEEDFYILKQTKCPAVLTESMFQDNKKDVAYINSEEGKSAIVALHVEGIISYIKSVS